MKLIFSRTIVKNLLLKQTRIIKKLIYTFVSILMLCNSAYATTYYVRPDGSDSNNGLTNASDGAWKTISKACTTMVAGDSASIQSGTYNETINTIRSGSSGSRITFLASDIVITGRWNVHHDYITIKGFTLNGNGIYISTRGGSDGNYCEILNNHITNKEIAILGNATGCLIRENNLVVTSGPGSDFTQITIFGTNNIAENNEIGPAQDIDAFRFWGHDNIIRNNYIHDITFSPGSSAHMDIFQTYGDNGDACYNYVIENNLCIHSQGQMFNLEETGANIHDIIFRNNVWAKFSQNGNIKMPNVQFYNNTFYDVGFFYNSSMNCSGTVFKNNMFIGLHGWYNNTDYSVGANGNLFRIAGGYTWTLQYNFFSQLNGIALKTFDNQTGGINGGAINFTNAAINDFTLLSNSPVIDHGTTLTGFNYDLIGITRPQGSGWDIGAYEYNSGTGVQTQSVLTETITFELSQNYPNPFNPITLIKYQVPKNSFVRISVYNICGIEVGTLVNQEQSTGSYEVKFDAHGLPGGEYFYRVHIGEFVESKKMLLIK